MTNKEAAEKAFILACCLAGDKSPHAEEAKEIYEHLRDQEKKGENQ